MEGTVLETVLAQHGTSSESYNYSVHPSLKSQLTEAARQRASLPLPSAATLGVIVYAAKATEEELGDENKINKHFLKIRKLLPIPKVKQGTLRDS